MVLAKLFVWPIGLLENLKKHQYDSMWFLATEVTKQWLKQVRYE